MSDDGIDRQRRQIRRHMHDTCAHLAQLKTELERIDRVVEAAQRRGKMSRQVVERLKILQDMRLLDRFFGEPPPDGP